MNGRLRHQAVGQRKANDTANEAGAAEEEEIPVEACRLLEWVLTSLCSQRRDVLSIVRLNRTKNTDTNLVLT